MAKGTQTKTTAQSLPYPWAFANGTVLGARSWQVSRDVVNRYALLTQCEAGGGKVPVQLAADEVTKIANRVVYLGNSLHGAQQTRANGEFRLDDWVVSVVTVAGWQVRNGRPNAALRVQHFVEATCVAEVVSFFVFPPILLVETPAEPVERDLYAAWRAAGPSALSWTKIEGANFEFPPGEVLAYSAFGGRNFHTDRNLAISQGFSGLVVPALMVEAKLANAISAALGPERDWTLFTRYIRPIADGETLILREDAAEQSAKLETSDGTAKVLAKAWRD